MAVWGHQARRGRALQLTNILRDVVEDASRGRVYLPRDARERFGCGVDRWTAAPGFADLMQDQIERARSFYAASAGLEAHLHPDGRRASWALMETYRQLLERIAQDPAAVLRTRVSLPWSAKAAVALRASVGRSVGKPSGVSS